MTISRNLSIFAANVTSSGTYTEFASGTLMLFQQTTAPTGWTKQTTHDNKALRVVSGSVTTGGVVPFTGVFANTTPTITTSGLSAAATTLTTTQMPSHTHTFPIVGLNGGGQAASAGCNQQGTVTTDATGGGSSHTHSISGSATSSAVTLAVAYVDLIIASKT
jgi:hypothetical protein